MKKTPSEPFSPYYLTQDTIHLMDELYIKTDSYIESETEIINLFAENESMPPSAQYYLIGYRYLTEIYKVSNKGNHSQIVVDFAEIYGINKSTMYAYSLFAKHLNIIKGKYPDCFYMLITEELKYNYRNIQNISTLAPDELQSLVEYAKEHINDSKYKDINRQIMLIKRNTSKNNIEKISQVNVIHKSQDNLPIKNIPAYDPDAELSSLVFTIPSWIGSTKRARKNTQIALTTKHTRDQLRDQLYELNDAITLMLMFIKEENIDHDRE